MFKQRLKECRIQKNLSVKELADLLSVVPRTIHYWEKGERECDFKTLVHLAKILDESTDYLLGND